MGGFKRSGLFGLIGVFVVAAVIAAIATTTGQGEANPKLTMGLIFGVIAVFVIALFALQRSDLERVAGGDALSSSRAAAEGGRQVENPMAMDEPDLWAAMATGPIDADAGAGAQRSLGHEPPQPAPRLAGDGADPRHRAVDLPP
jgi:hypothetical protein